MFYYHAHGLNIASEIFFPELIKLNYSPKKIEVLIKFGEISFQGEVNEYYLNKITKFHVSESQIKIFWEEILICSLVNKKEIIINQHTNIEEDLLRIIILSYAITTILHLIGRLVLHANAVRINNKAILFLGKSGQGKSTLSLSLHKKGHMLLSDDIISIYIDKNDSPKVYPSFPRIKLWPDVIINSAEDIESTSLLHPLTDKRSYYLNDKFDLHSVPLKTIYLIKNSENFKISDLNCENALIEVIKSSYCYPVFNLNDISRNLKQSAKIVEKVPVKLLKIKHDFNDISKIIEIISELESN